MSDKKHFPNGLYFKRPHENAPDFVKGQVSIRVEEFKSYLGRVNGEWLNIDLKVSKEGKPYAEVNTFKPEKKEDPRQVGKGDFPDIDSEPDLPF